MNARGFLAATGIVGALLWMMTGSADAQVATQANMAMGQVPGPTGPMGPSPVFAGTCTLDGASPAKCSVVISPFPVVPPVCVCSSVGATAQIAGKGCAVSVVGATVTITAQNNDNHVENIICYCLFRGSPCPSFRSSSIRP